MIRQEPVLASLRRPAKRPADRRGRIAQFRSKAEELRTLSDDVILQQTRATLLRLADSYDRMACLLESIEAAPV
jgi:hypothetical protein